MNRTNHLVLSEPAGSIKIIFFLKKIASKRRRFGGYIFSLMAAWNYGNSKPSPPQFAPYNYCQRAASPAPDVPPTTTPGWLPPTAITSRQPAALEADKAHPLLLLIILKRQTVNIQSQMLSNCSWATKIVVVISYASFWNCKAATNQCCWS